MSQVIGRVRLSRSRVGYFDELTRIHLTVSNPEKPVYAGMNTANLKRAVRSGVLHLVAGSLELEQNKAVKDMHVAEAMKTTVEEKVATVLDTLVKEEAEQKTEAPIEKAATEEVIAEAKEVVIEETIEEATTPEEVVEEEATEEATETKTTSRKRKATTNKQ